MADSKFKPSYYKARGGYDVIDVIKAFDLNFNLGNVLKYIARAGKKTEEKINDLQKAREYIDREIKYLEFIKEEDAQRQKDYMADL